MALSVKVFNHDITEYFNYLVMGRLALGADRDAPIWEERINGTATVSEDRHQVAAWREMEKQRGQLLVWNCCTYTF